MLRALLEVGKVVGIAGSHLSDLHEVTVISLFFCNTGFCKNGLFDSFFCVFGKRRISWIAFNPE